MYSFRLKIRVAKPAIGKRIDHQRLAREKKSFFREVLFFLPLYPEYVCARVYAVALRNNTTRPLVVNIRAFLDLRVRGGKKQSSELSGSIATKMKICYLNWKTKSDGYGFLRVAPLFFYESLRCRSLSLITTTRCLCVPILTG